MENLELGFCKDEQENKIKKKTKYIHPWHLQYMNENYNWSVSQRPKTGLYLYLMLLQYKYFTVAWKSTN